MARRLKVKNVVRFCALAIVTSVAVVGLVGITPSSASSRACEMGSAVSGFALLDDVAVSTAPIVRIIATQVCPGAASSVASDPQLISAINSNPAYNRALRAGGYPNTDIYGATLAGDVLIVYIHDQTRAFRPHSRRATDNG
jgi:hypothetical protein